MSEIGLINYLFPSARVCARTLGSHVIWTPVVPLANYGIRNTGGRPTRICISAHQQRRTSAVSRTAKAFASFTVPEMVREYRSRGCRQLVATANFEYHLPKVFRGYRPRGDVRPGLWPFEISECELCAGPPQDLPSHHRRPVRPLTSLVTYVHTLIHRG